MKRKETIFLSEKAATNSCKEFPDNYKIIVVAQGGLANRMRAIASSYFYAKELQRDLYVIWFRNNELNSSFGDLFNTENLPFNLVEPDSIKYHIFFEQPRKRNLFISRIIRKLLNTCTIKDIHLLSPQSIIETLKRINHDVLINSGLQFADIDTNLLHEIFHFSENVSATKKNILQGHTPDYALQIRRTDNRESILYSPLHSFEEIIEARLKENDNSLFFLATDDTPTKNYLTSKYPDNIITNVREARRDTREGMVDAAAEMLIMSECQTIYGSYWSSFSELAALYGGRNLVVVGDGKMARPS